MRYITYLILFVFVSVLADDVSADTDRYRVEVILLSHLHHAEQPREIKWLKDFSTALDFLTPAQEAEDDDSAEEIVEELPPDPNAVVHVEEMSSVMQEAWRRMRRSAPFRPEQYLSWEQGSEAPFPVLRMHDLETVQIDDPWFEQRLALEEDAANNTEVQTISPDEAEDDPADLLPAPISYYRLDGTVMLERKRFLHLVLNLQMREAVFEEELADQFALTASPDRFSAEGLPPVKPSSFLVFNLQQSRQVKTARMEYFDGPVLSVLAYVSHIEPLEPQE